MSKLVVKLIVAAASSVLVFSAVAPASATTWLVTNVLTVGNDGGFGASSFHDARGNEMSGLNIATINGNVFGAPPTASGSYNDVTGVLDFTAMATQGANNFNATNGTYDEVSETTLGMDVRLRLERSTTTSEVPAPAVTVIFGFGLIGLA